MSLRLYVPGRMHMMPGKPHLQHTLRLIWKGDKRNQGFGSLGMRCEGRGRSGGGQVWMGARQDAEGSGQYTVAGLWQGSCAHGRLPQVTVEFVVPSWLCWSSAGAWQNLVIYHCFVLSVMQLMA